MSNLKRIAMVVAAMCIASAAMAQKPVIYPAKGQSSQQQSKDDSECYAWAKQTTGIDPAAIAQTPPPQTTTTTTTSTAGGQRVKGALRGAAGGAIIGEIANDDASEGAAIGAVVGTMAGGRQARQQQQQQAQQQAQQQQQQQQAQQQQQQKIDTFYVSYGACMEGRGYTVK